MFLVLVRWELCFLFVASWDDVLSMTIFEAKKASHCDRLDFVQKHDEEGMVLVLVYVLFF